ncbi:MAG TPA: carboxymuconolactone decarboxylase family protein [Candidatus Binatia bacterium]|nr:carboxymuconolactone decarboxylase family protein [Candidatus Binatia bacterium]
MAYIRHIPPSEACGRLAHVYREIRAEVPRVPNLIQVFSLRPETMESIHRHWLSAMWVGRVPRRTKELMAMVVSKAAKCPSCTDTHMIFLQAAGMDRTTAYETEARLADAPGLSARERAAVAFAVKLTLDPRGIKQADLQRLDDAWPDPDERCELVSVVCAFNAIARIANALGVQREIPGALTRFETSRRGAISLLARITTLSLDLSERPVRARTPEENRAAMLDLFTRELGFSGIPPGYDRLERCPEMFDGQLATIQRAVAVVPRDRWMRIGLVVARLTGCKFFSTHCAAWLEHRGIAPAAVIAGSEGVEDAPADTEEASLRFTRDLTLHSHKISAERVDELRNAGLSDGAILDIAYVAGVFNGLVRLVTALAPLEGAVLA